MSTDNWLATQFEQHREHLTAVAYRMLGSPTEADDAVQEAWIKVSRAGTDGVENLGGWLTTAVSRVCLDMLRSRASRREQPFDDHVLEPAAPEPALDPEQEALLADSVGLAMLVVLDKLAPAERIAFVLHDMFDLPFEDIAPIVGRNPAAARQLASRARRRVRGATAPSGSLDRRRAIVDAFLAASRAGDFAALLAVLDPDVVVLADAAVQQSGAAPEVRGARAVAETFAGRARAAQPALIDGEPGLVWLSGGQPRVVFRLTMTDATISAIELLADPATLAALDLDLLTD